MARRGLPAHRFAIILTVIAVLNAVVSLTLLAQDDAARRRGVPAPQGVRRPQESPPEPTPPPAPRRREPVMWPGSLDRRAPTPEEPPRPFEAPAPPEALETAPTAPAAAGPIAPRKGQPAPQVLPPGAGVALPEGPPEPATAETPTAPTQRGEAIERALEAQSGRTIPSDAFIQTPFADAFTTGDYPRALAELDQLRLRYPNDPLILRYRAIVLDRLGRYDEALEIYDGLLSRTPRHVPTRFFRGQTYYRAGDVDHALEELQWVADNSAQPYRRWSRELINELHTSRVQAPERKRLYVFGNLGWEYDSNAILQSEDPGLRVGSDRSAGRFSLNAGTGYRFLQEPDLRLDGTYVARQSLHDDGLDEYNFTEQAVALDLRKRITFAERDMTLGLRYELSGGFLDGRTFELANAFRLSSDVRFTPQTRTVVYHRFAVAEFGPDGPNPPQTSRDGLENDLGLIQYFYSDDFRRYLFLGEEFTDDAKRGANYDRIGFTTRVGVHVPVPYVPRTDLDTSVSFRYMDYPRFASLSSLDPDQRRDTDWEYYLALTYRITPRILTRAFYRYINANNRNDFYQYDRHIGGTQLLFTQYY